LSFERAGLTTEDSSLMTSPCGCIHNSRLITHNFTAQLYNARVPPRYAYWTILIDNTPTAFRSRDQAELLPTLNQLLRKSSNVVM
jgi:hypothetical protein